MINSGKNPGSLFVLSFSFLGFFLGGGFVLFFSSHQKVGGVF